MPPDTLKQLEARVGHTFADRRLLSQALTHSSFSGAVNSYERLEFLGDRVLGLLLAEHFYSRFSGDAEGALSIRLHAEARMSTLAGVARDLDLAVYIRAQSGFEVAGNDNVLADVMESLMAAIYLDGGLDAARAFLVRHWPLKGAQTAERQKDAKSQLQEWCLQRGMGLPSYRQTDKSGPDHAPELTYEVSISGYPGETATGNNRKNAEQAAAALLLARLDKESS
jgi:ribonuclease-3